MREIFSALSILHVGGRTSSFTTALSGASVKVCASLAASLTILRLERFDLVIIERELPDGDGLVLGPVIARSSPQAISILIMEEHQWASTEAALRLGFSAIFSPATINLDLIAELLQRKGAFSGRRSERRSRALPLSRLTEAEREILLLIATGATNEEIAKSRHNSIATVKSHLTSIYRKLEVRNRAGAISVLNRN